MTPRLLERCPMFAKLGPEDRERVAAIGSLRSLTRGEMLFAEGDRADHFFVVLDGDVKLFKSSVQGKEQILHIIRPVHSFAEAAVFLGGGYPASAMALRPSKVFQIPRDGFFEYRPGRSRIFDPRHGLIRHLAAPVGRSRR
ncbi:MAG: cyclic nucleotide-binding domain-containing protein [Deltaproteobacteria bacterium]|nr:cyclic nucleotide-binding domain-containing protein [Deltaproteobacteria bacterium]